jgi:DNA-binding MarR family transcriptional regulator
MVIRLCEGRFGITRREWRVDRAACAGTGLLSSELADRIQLDRARTSRAVSSLVAKKLVRRQTGVADRRQARLALTEQGPPLHAALFPLVCEINRGLLAPLSREATCSARRDRWPPAGAGRCDGGRRELPKADRRRGGRARLAMG